MSNVQITGKQFTVTADVKTFVQDRILGIEECAGLKVTSVNVVLEREKNRFHVNIVFNCKLHSINAKAEDFELLKAIDLAMDKLEHQAMVLHGKIRDHHAVGLSHCEVRKVAEEEAAAAAQD
jgi:ribosomal subunit interface protein